MAAINPPAWMQAGTYPARTDRLVLSALLSYPGFQTDESFPMRVRQGVKPSYQNYQLKVRAAATPNMTVIVSAGFCVIDQHDSGGSGTYICVNDGDVTLSIAAAGSTGQYRKDTIVASVYDAEYAGTASEWRLEVIKGPNATSAAAAVRGSLPPNAQILADIAVGPNQTSVAAGNITDVRQFTSALGGIIPAPSNAAPTRLHPGQMAYRTDTDDLVIGTLAGPTRSLREVIRPVQSMQAATPPLNQSATYVDYTASAWPPITVTVPPSGMVTVAISADISNTNSSTATCWAAWRASGALTLTASAFNSCCIAGARAAVGRQRTLTGMTPGASLTITPQWNISSGSTSTANVAGGVLEVTPVA